MADKDKPGRVGIIDSTLRDGIQAPGIKLPLDSRLKVAQTIADAGVDELEAGFPAASELDLNAVSKIAALKLHTRVSAWCRAAEADIDAAAKTGADIAHISIPASDILLNAIGKNRQWAIDTLGKLIPIAKDRFPSISIGFQDSPRADPEFTIKLARQAAKDGAARVRFADSCGVWNPFATSDFFRKLSAETPGIPLGIHAHNDIGMATANSIGAVIGGARLADSTVNGLGERSGNTPLAELAVALKEIGASTGINLARMTSLSSLVSKLTGIQIPPDKPVVGQNAFLHHSGIHVKALANNPLAYQPFLPRSVGQKHDLNIVIGQLSGRASVKLALQKLGRDTSRNSIESTLEKLKTGAPSKLDGGVIRI